MRATASAILADVFDVTPVESDSQIRLSEAGHGPSLAIVGTGTVPTDLPADTPILWLAPTPRWVPPPSPHPSSTLARDFVPPELRAAVRRIMAGAPREGGSAPATRLAHPFLSVEAVAAAEQAVRTALPVLICGPRCTSRGAVAQAIHREAGGGPFVIVSPRSLDPHAPLAPDSGSIFIDRLEALGAAQQDYVLAALQPDGTFSSRPGQRLRVLGGTECGIDPMLEDPHASADLLYRLNVLPLAVVPLRDRPQDIPALAQAIATALARTIGLAAVSFTPRALDRLSQYLWFGDIAELEAVLARTLALTRKELVDAEDLRFGPSDRATQPLPETSGGRPLADPATLHSRALDLVINEVAHELKNPLSTIKTFAQHLRRQGSEGSEEQQLARLTNDAVDEIDNTVENLVQFTRLDEPLREPVALQAVLAPAVALLTQLVRPRTRRVDYRPPPPVSVSVDRGQVIYGLSNLFRALARGLGDTGRIVIDYEDPGRVVMELPTGFDPSEAHLAALVGAPEPKSPSSLAAAIAQRVLERNGGVLAFETQRQPPRVTVQFPLSAVEEVPLARNAQTPRVGR